MNEPLEIKGNELKINPDALDIPVSFKWLNSEYLIWKDEENRIVLCEILDEK